MIYLILIPLLIILVYSGFIIYTGYHFKLSKFEGYAVYLQKFTIIIPARNEEENLLYCLDSICRQNIDPSAMEVIVVDDHSTDRTIRSAEYFLDKLDLKIFSTFLHGKKHALDMGIDKASNNIIITVDADCNMPANWLITMISYFMKNRLTMLCGLIRMEDDATFFQRLQQAESAAIVGISAVMLNNGMPSTCNGANMVFRKDVFRLLGGYFAREFVTSGDDDLIMQRFAKNDMESVRYLIHKDALVQTSSSRDFKTFIRQRTRWLSKRHKYEYKFNNILHALVMLHLVSFYVFLVLLFTSFYPVAISMILLKYVAELYYGMRLRKIIAFDILLIFLMPFFQLYILLVLFHGMNSTNEWKGRKI